MADTYKDFNCSMLQATGASFSFEPGAGGYTTYACYDNGSHSATIIIGGTGQSSIVNNVLKAYFAKKHKSSIETMLGKVGQGSEMEGCTAATSTSNYLRLLITYDAASSITGVKLVDEDPDPTKRLDPIPSA